MITAFLTFVFFFAIVGCVLYGRKLIKTEKVDAVFGNPERAQGGIHWVIVGSSFLLLVWLIIHGILQNLSFQNLLMNFVKLER